MVKNSHFERKSMKESSKNKSKITAKSNGSNSGPMLKFNHIRRDTLPQTRFDVRALEMVRAYPLYVKELEGHEPPMGEVLEQCIINTLSNDTDFVEWLLHHPKTEVSEQSGNSATGQKEVTLAE